MLLEAEVPREWGELEESRGDGVVLGKAVTRAGTVRMRPDVGTSGRPDVGVGPAAAARGNCWERDEATAVAASEAAWALDYWSCWLVAPCTTSAPTG